MESVDPLPMVSITLEQRVVETQFGPRDEFRRGSASIDVQPPPAADPARDRALVSNILREAKAAGLEVARNRDSVLQAHSSSGRAKYYGGPPVVHAFVELITISGPYLAQAGLAAGGFAAFVRNVLGSIDDWRKIRGQRSMTINVRGKQIEIKENATAEDVVRAIEQALK